MLQEILSSQNVKRPTMSLAQAINKQSFVPEIIRLSPPGKQNAIAEQFADRLQKAATKVLKNNDANTVSKNILDVINE